MKADTPQVGFLLYLDRSAVVSLSSLHFSQADYYCGGV